MHPGLATLMYCTSYRQDPCKLMLSHGNFNQAYQAHYHNMYVIEWLQRRNEVCKGGKGLGSNGSGTSKQWCYKRSVQRERQGLCSGRGKLAERLGFAGKDGCEKRKCVYVGGGEQVTFCILLIVCGYCTCKLGENNSNASQRSLYIFHVIKTGSCLKQILCVKSKIWQYVSKKKIQCHIINIIILSQFLRSGMVSRNMAPHSVCVSVHEMKAMARS